MTKHSTIAMLICLLGLNLAAANAQAGPTLVVTGGILQGAKGVLVNGQLYDVTFVNGTCAAVFSGCDDPSDFQFTTLAAATAASQALKDQVFLDDPLGSFDTDPTKTNGCAFGVGGTYCYVLTPYAPHPSSIPPTVDASAFLNDIPETNDDVNNIPGIAALIAPHIAIAEDATYAIFSAAVFTVGIDIKPGSFPNSINLSSGGATPVAILGSASLNVNDIDVGTLTLGTAGVKTVGKTDRALCSVKDVSGEFSAGLEGAPDGFLDLVCHFITVSIVPEAGGTKATLRGNFLPGVGGGAIEGTDSVQIVP